MPTSRSSGVRAGRSATSMIVILYVGVLSGCDVGAASDRHGTAAAVPVSVAPALPVASAAASAPLVTLLPPPPPSIGSQWDYAHDEDEMTGKVSHIASVTSDNTVEFSSPYDGAQHGHLIIRRHPRFGNDVIFRIERGQLLCWAYDNCTVLVRFDDDEPLIFSANPPASGSNEAIFIENDARFLAKMRAAKQVRISPKVYQEGSVVFSFDVSGFDMKQYRGE